MSTPPENKKTKNIFFGLLQKGRSLDDRSIVIKVLWKRLIVFLVVLGTVGWMGKSVAFYYFFKDYKGYPNVTFAEMLIFPANLKAYRVKMGSYDIEQCQLALEQGDFAAARVYAYTGVLRSPANLKGRIHLAILNKMYRRPDQAMEVMRQGIPYLLQEQPDFSREAFEYMDVLYDLYITQREDKALSSIVDGFLEAVPGITPMTKAVATRGAALASLRGDFNRAERFIQEYQLEDFNDGTLIAAELARRRGDMAMAIRLLERGVLQFPNKEPFFLRLISYLREAGQLDKALQYAHLYALHKPLKVVPFIQIFYCLYDLGDRGALTQQIKRFLKQFGDDPQALEKLAYFSAKTEQRALSQQLYQIALERDFKKKSRFLFLLLEVAIRQGNYMDAVTALQTLNEDDLITLKRQGRLALFYGFQAIAYYASGDEALGEYAFEQFLQISKAPLNDQIAIARHCQRINWPDKAFILFDRAHRTYPKSEHALEGLIYSQLNLGVSDYLIERVYKLLETRRPPLALLERAYTTLVGDRFLFTSSRGQLLDKLEGAIKMPLYSAGIR